MSIQKCNMCFQSQYAYIDNKPVHIDDYKKNLLHRKDDILCRQGHQLVAVLKCTYRRSHFRHKHSSDVAGGEMCEWHSAWQGEFEVSEFVFQKIDNQIKERRADVYIESHNLIVEFQHSNISKEEVNNRKHDYELHNKKIIWVIDGNGCTEKMELNNGRLFFTFNSDWIYNSFTSYDIIYLDYDGNIYKIYPEYVKSKMFDVEPPYTHEQFIQFLLSFRGLSCLMHM